MMDHMMGGGMMWGIGLIVVLIIIVLFSPPRHWSNTSSSPNAREQGNCGIRSRS